MVGGVTGECAGGSRAAAAVGDPATLVAPEVADLEPLLVLLPRRIPSSVGVIVVALICSGVMAMQFFP